MINTRHGPGQNGSNHKPGDQPRYHERCPRCHRSVPMALSENGWLFTSHGDGCPHSGQPHQIATRP